MNAPSHSSSSRGLVITLLAAVFLLYGVVGFMLYRGRVIPHWAFCQSDFVIFALPFLAAILANAGVLFFWMRPQSLARVARHLAISFALAVLAWLVYMVCAVNTYGE
jgi:hypothetical protein